MLGYGTISLVFVYSVGVLNRVNRQFNLLIFSCYINKGANKSFLNKCLLYYWGSHRKWKLISTSFPIQFCLNEVTLSFNMKPVSKFHEICFTIFWTNIISNYKHTLYISTIKSLHRALDIHDLFIIIPFTCSIQAQLFELFIFFYTKLLFDILKLW